MSSPSARVEEALESLRSKHVRSATLERLRLTWEADALVQDLPQPLALGRGLGFILERISLPVSPDDLLVGRVAEQVPEAADEAWLRERTASRWLPEWMHDVGHCCFAWDSLLGLGLPGLEAFAACELEARTADGDDPHRLDFLRGAILVYGAFRTLARRYARAAESAGLLEAAARCRAMADRPPARFAEALQLVWLVGLVYCAIVAPNPAISFGRVDELLLGHYRAEVGRGDLSRDDAGDLIEDFYCKMNLVMGRGEHLMGADVGRGSATDTGWSRNLVYDSPLYVVLGGRRSDGGEPVNELTALFAERIVARFENPVVVFRHTADVPEPLWRLVCAAMRQNAAIQVFSDAAVIPGLVHAGIAPHDALGYTMHGCNEPDIPGKQKMVGWSFDRSFWLPRYFLDALRLAPPESFDLEEVYAAFARLVSADVARICDELRAARAAWSAQAPGVLRVDDCLHDGPVARATSWELGGVEYRNLFLSICSLATAADSFAAVDEVVTRRRLLPLGKLAAVLGSDYAGQEALRRLCLGAPKLGQDDDRADSHAARILEMLTEIIDACSRPGSSDEVVCFGALYTLMGHIPAGQNTGATPDGRLAGTPLSENLSPSPGSAIHGLTAMLGSIAKLPLHRFATGILNVRVRPDLFAGERGLDALAALLRTHLEGGGIQVQLTCAGTEELKEAQVHPERHRDLMVRVTGYSAAFTDMTPGAQEEIVRREELGAGRG